ncbi:hypothetical protein LAV72_18425 [Lysinibacillus xylanilyticus]|uniref:hypothetical protein n=1 Tax=Lysinibacillus TaxID=400634 RepID=UPI002B255953|nr:hypothetical protein [Lysinibacillus xylanilyticus]MEB2301582.1 hypothetical protein [Lysinibacillus xylanilyticus]
MSTIKIPVTLYDKTQTFIEIHSIKAFRVSLTFWLLGESIPFTVTLAQNYTISLPLIPEPIFLESYVKGGHSE